jgi:hypothetical protein
MSFVSGNFETHRGYGSLGQPIGYYHTYSHSTDDLDTIANGSYFPPDSLRTGDVVICQAVDGYKLGYVVNPSGSISWGVSL